MLEKCIYLPKSTWSYQKTGERHETDPSLPTPWFQTYGSQNCKTVSFHCLKPLHLWYCVTAALGNWYTRYGFLYIFLAYYAGLKCQCTISTKQLSYLRTRALWNVGFDVFSKFGEIFGHYLFTYSFYPTLFSLLLK